MSVRNCAELGVNLQYIVKRLFANQDFLKLLYYTCRRPPSGFLKAQLGYSWDTRQIPLECRFLAQIRDRCFCLYCPLKIKDLKSCETIADVGDKSHLSLYGFGGVQKRLWMTGQRCSGKEAGTIPLRLKGKSDLALLDSNSLETRLKCRNELGSPVQVQWNCDSAGILHRRIPQVVEERFS